MLLLLLLLLQLLRLLLWLCECLLRLLRLGRQRCAMRYHLELFLAADMSQVTEKPQMKATDECPNSQPEIGPDYDANECCRMIGCELTLGT